MNYLYIFDMDGVLLDSEILYKKLNFELFNKLGVTITEDEYREFIGISARLMWDYIREKGNLSQSSEELMELEKEAKFNMLNNTDLEPNPEVTGFLKYLQNNGFHIALASYSPMDNIRLILEKLHLRSYFEHIVSGDMIANGKPAPDIFLKTAYAFSANPGNCTVIEDSRNGTLAAKAAGMKCIGYRNPGSGNQNLSRADIVIESFSDERLYELVPT